MNTCSKCLSQFTPGRTIFGRVVKGKFIEFCSKQCRAAWESGADVRKARRRRSDAQAARKATRPSEAAISRNAADLLDARGLWHTRLQSGAVELKSGHYMQLCRPGTPDRVFADGLIVFLEIKKPDETPSDAQIDAMAELTNNGALAFVVDDFGQLEFIEKQLAARRSRIMEIRDAIRDIQNEISAAIAARTEPAEPAKTK